MNCGILFFFSSVLVRAWVEVSQHHVMNRPEVAAYNECLDHVTWTRS